MIRTKRSAPPGRTVARRLTAALLAGAGMGGALVAVSPPASPVERVSVALQNSPQQLAGVLRPQGEKWGDDSTGEGKKANLETGSWKADNDRGSAFSTAEDIGAQDVWGKSAPTSGRKLTGYGVGVALIDTGVSPVEGLLTAGKLVNGPDLSFESQSANTRYLDGYGHGTHMAGLIAGRDSAVSTGNEKDKKYFVGMAPDAKIVNVKVGSADGGVDVSQVIAGIDWVVSNRQAHNIRVLNLSYGTDSVQAPESDPLAHAVQNAWRAGIVVVVAAGNDGDGAGEQRLTMPAIDPYVLAVGSTDHQGSDKPEAERVGSWTNEGTAIRRPDIVAPGKSAVSLRVPGSFADRGHPEGLVPGNATGRFFRGTGTSQSAAVVSGAVALLMQRNPSLTPDQVKGLVKGSADLLKTGTSAVQGAGEINIKGAVELLEKGSRSSYAQTWVRSTGTGTLDGARGGSYVTDPDNGAQLRGEQDIFGQLWDASAWAGASTAGTAWTAGTWRESEWAGSGWSGSSWSGAPWSRRSWSGVDWSRRSWSSLTFLRRSWSGDDFQRRSWSADYWSRRSWSSHDAW